MRGHVLKTSRQYKCVSFTPDIDSFHNVEQKLQFSTEFPLNLIKHDAGISVPFSVLADFNLLQTTTKVKSKKKYKNTHFIISFLRLLQ